MTVIREFIELRFVLFSAVQLASCEHFLLPETQKTATGRLQSEADKPFVQ